MSDNAYRYVKSLTLMCYLVIAIGAGSVVCAMCKDIGYAARTFGEVMETYKR